jgi:hypothetical protein
MLEAIFKPEFVSALSTAVLAAFVAMIVAYVNLRQTKRAYSSSIEARLEGLYDRLMDYRLKHPEVFKLSRSWTRDCLTKIYLQSNDEERSWAIYVGYVELCISYCNAVLLAQRRRLLAKQVYTSQHEPLVRMLITEHFPIIHQFTSEGFGSSAIAEFISRERANGWKWEDVYSTMHQPRDRRTRGESC